MAIIAVIVIIKILWTMKNRASPSPQGANPASSGVFYNRQSPRPQRRRTGGDSSSTVDSYSYGDTDTGCGGDSGGDGGGCGD